MWALPLLKCAHIPCHSLSSSTPVGNAFSVFIFICKTAAGKEKKKGLWLTVIPFQISSCVNICYSSRFVLFGNVVFVSVTVSGLFFFLLRNNLKNRVVFSQHLFITVALLWAALARYNSCYEAPDTNAVETLSLLYWSALLRAANACASGSHVLWTKHKWKLWTASVKIGLAAVSISFDSVLPLS